MKVGNAIIKDHLDAPKKEKRRSGGTSSKFHVERARVFEIEKIIHHRHGPFVDTDDQIIYAQMAACHLREPNSIRSWCLHYCPGLNIAQVRHIIAEGIAPQRLPTADEVAKELAITYAERSALGLKTIGAIDFTKEQRAALAIETKRERDRVRVARKRRAEGRKPRAKFVAESVAETCRRLGISRKTYYKRKAKEMSKGATGNGVTHASPHINTSTRYTERHTCYPPDRQSPRGVHAVTLGAIKAAQKIIAEGGAVTAQQVAASAVNRGRLDWRQQIIRNAQACIAAGIDPCDDLDDPNIIRDDPPSAA